MTNQAECLAGRAGISITRGAATIAVAFLLVMAAFPSAAQEVSSAIRGKVTTSDGNPVPNADIVVVDTRTGIKRTYSTNASGTFLAAKLPVGGPYTVSVGGGDPVTVPNITLGEIYRLPLVVTLANVEEVVVTGTSSELYEVAPGPAATFSSYDIETNVAFNRDIVDVYSVDPRLNIDNEDDGFEVNCAGKHPRFNSVTLDGVSQNDRFGLNSNGYSTAVGMPFPFDAIEQISVELAPFDVTYGGFSACNINSVTKSGGNEWEGKGWFEWTNDNLRGDELGGTNEDFSTPKFNDHKRGFSFSGPILENKLFVSAAYEEGDRPRFLAIGYNGSGNGIERPWLSQADFERIQNIANTVYGYDPGGQPGDGIQEEEKYLVRLDWNINENHNLGVIYNYYDGFQDRNSDGDDDEFEFANHFYVKGAESKTSTLILESQWTDAFSTEFFYSMNEMNDSQVTVGPKDFGDFQISIDRDTVYLGADDSRQANKLNTESDFFKLKGQVLFRDHILTFGVESEELTIFNQFVQHSNGGEYDFFDDSGDNPAFCADLTAQERFDNPDCELSGIDRFELGRPSRVYYGSGGGTNNPDDAAANFSNRLNSAYFQDEFLIENWDMTVVAGLRYDWFTSSDSPNFNQAFTDANGGLRNDANIDGVDLLMPRIGVTWEARDFLTVRSGIGLYSGGNPNVWISNAWSNDGLTNVQLRNNYFDSATILPGMPDSLQLSGNGQPGFDVPQEMVDEVAATTAANASDSFLVIIDPDYEQPSELKFALGATWDTGWNGVVIDADYLFTELRDSAYYVDLSQDVVGMTTLGQPIYDYVNGRDNFMLTNSGFDANANVFSLVLNKSFDWGLDMTVGYSYTDAEDVSPMTSSTAGSNFDNTALLDINNPRPATSNYVSPERWTFRGTYANEFFSNLETRVTLLGYASEGQPQSYVMNGGDLEGDGFFGRHLLYIPNGAGDPNVVFDADFPTDEFFAWASREGLKPGFVDRNAKHARWTTRWDMRVDQEIPTFVDKVKGRVFFKMYNVGNFLNKDWGKVHDAFFFSQEVVDASINDNGQYVYEGFRDRSVDNVLEQRSLWEARVGLTISF